MVETNRITCNYSLSQTVCSFAHTHTRAHTRTHTHTHAALAVVLFVALGVVLLLIGGAFKALGGDDGLVRHTLPHDVAFPPQGDLLQHHHTKPMIHNMVEEATAPTHM